MAISNNFLSASYAGFRVVAHVDSFYDGESQTDIYLCPSEVGGAIENLSRESDIGAYLRRGSYVEQVTVGRRKNLSGFSPDAAVAAIREFCNRDKSN